MLLHIKGSNKKVRKAVEHAAWYYAEKLMGKRLLGSLEITINLKKDLLIKEGNEGTAIWEDDNIRPKEFTISLTSGSQSQTVTATNAITPFQYTVTSICNSATSVYASNLPTGVSTTLNNNIIAVSGTPTAQSTGTFNYSLTVSGTTKSSTVTGTITVVASFTTSSIYFENGTCKCPNANVGETGTISGTLYTVVDNSTIQGLVNNGNFNLCTTKVTNMSGVFNSKTSFNTNINFWDTSNVTDMNAMFYNATAFNQNISSWDTSKVVNMHRLFYLATSFNQPIGNWNTSSANNMSGMFEGASAFNQNIGNWNTSNLIQNNNLSGGGGLISTFKDASAFNQNLSGWCVSNIGSEPNNFSTSSALTNANKPKWGKEFTVTLKVDFPASGLVRL
mgnify:CR=1 FL=1